MFQMEKEGNIEREQRGGGHTHSVFCIHIEQLKHICDLKDSNINTTAHILVGFS